MRPIGQIGLIRRIRRIGRIREIGSRAPHRPFFEGWKVRSPVSGVWSPYGRKTEEAEDMDAEVQDGQSPTERGGTGRAEPYRMRVGGRNLFPKTKSEGKGSKKKAYIQIKNRKDLHMCIFCCNSTYSPLLLTGAPSNVTVASCRPYARHGCLFACSAYSV